MDGRRGGFTLIEILVAIGVIAVLIALTAAAVMRARESARRLGCANNLRQMGVALAGFESAHGRFPPGRDARRGRDHSWATAVLPYLDQAPLAGHLDPSRPWDDPANRPFATASPAIFRCPAALEAWPGKTDYGGCYGTTLTGLPPGFRRGAGWEAGALPPAGIDDSHAPFRRSGVALAEVRDGTSHTFLVVEDADRPACEGGLWATGHNCLAVDQGPVNTARSNEIFSRHDGGASALMADGAVRFITEAAAPPALGALATRSGREPPAPSAQH